MRSNIILNRWSVFVIAAGLLALLGQAVYSQGDGGRVMLDATSGKAFVSNITPGLKDAGAVADQVWVTVTFSDPALAHAMIAVVTKGGEQVEVKLALEGRYARGSTMEFKGMPVIGEWNVRIKGESLTGMGVYMTIDCVRGPAAPAPTTGVPSNVIPVPITRPTPVTPAPVVVPTPRPLPPSGSGEIAITPEIQYQALTRILIRKGIITAPELAAEIQRVAAER